MSLIVCSECGKTFSDHAIACPNCACPTESILQQEKKDSPICNSIDYEIDGDTSKCKACLNCGAVYFNTAAEGYREGYCIECRSRNLYDKLEKINYSTEEFNRAANKFSLKENWFQKVYRLKRELFETYVQNWETLDKNCDSYKLNIEDLYHAGAGEIHSSIKKDAERKAEEWQKSRSTINNVPKCPTCQSGAVRKIGNVKKGVSVAVWGLLSDDFGKIYECTNCGYKW